MKSKIILYLFLSILFISTSCKKFLDREPYSQASDQTSWKAEGDANASVAACYSLIRSALNAAITHFSYGDIATDEFNDIVGGDIDSYRAIANVNWAVSIPAVNTYDPRLKLRLYTNFYTAISQSNRCVYFINKMPDNVFAGDTKEAQAGTKNKYLGEAYFTRAFNYFYMARVWGDIPLVTTYYPDASLAPELERVAQKSILNQCIADLSFAKQNLSWRDNASADRGVRADKGAVFALMAHIYAWQGLYDSCRMACDSVILSNTYSYVPRNNFLSIFMGQSSEGIFEIAQNNLSESMRASDAFSITGVTLSQPYINGPTVPAWQINTATTNYLYSDTNDLRYKKAFVQIINGSNNSVECIKYANIQNVNSNVAYQVALNNIIIFRYADIVLLKAEALALQSAPDYTNALNLVNEVRGQANAAPLDALSSTDLVNAIFTERGSELFLEGHRFYDLVRLARVTKQSPFANINYTEFLAGKYYWPLDPTLFLTNTKLKQTPFWVGKIR